MICYEAKCIMIYKIVPVTACSTARPTKLRKRKAGSANSALARLILSAALLLGVSACGSESADSGEVAGDGVYVPGAGPQFTPTTTESSEIEPAGVTEIEPGKYVVVLHAYNWSFDPKEIRVPAGSEVQFRAYSMQDYHGLAITGTDVLLDLLPTEVAVANHTFTTPGEHLFVCSVYCEEGHVGMQGKIIVE